MRGVWQGAVLMARLAPAWVWDARRWRGTKEFLLLLLGVGPDVAGRVIERLRRAMPTEVTCSFEGHVRRG